VSEITKPIPLDEALAAIDTPEAVADRRNRAEKMAEQLEGRDRGKVIWAAGTIELNKALSPLRFGGSLIRPNDAARRAAEIEAGRNVDALVARQCEITLRAADVAGVYSDPDRLECERIWQAYCKQVNAVAYREGNKIDAFIVRFKDLIATRNDAEAFGGAEGLRSAEARLQRLTGVPYPQLPEAAWAAADELGLAERQDEYDRLEQKYGRRHPAANGTGPKTTSRKRLTTRPMSALTTTR